MHYADEHFSSDPAFFASISTLASELISQSKRYPHPLVLYKTVLRKQGENKRNPLPHSLPVPEEG